MNVRPPLPMRPDGFFGRPFALLMEAMNTQAYATTLSILDPPPGSTLLEIGFGTGAFLERAAHSMKKGRLIGVDPSPLMVKMATARLRKFTRRFDIDLRVGDDLSINEPPKSVNRIAALHSFQFWTAPEIALARLRSMLADGGALCLALRNHGKYPPQWLPNPISRSGSETALTLDALKAAGFDRASLAHSTRATDFVSATVY